MERLPRPRVRFAGVWVWVDGRATTCGTPSPGGRPIGVAAPASALAQHHTSASRLDRLKGHVHVERPRLQGDGPAVEALHQRLPRCGLLTLERRPGGGLLLPPCLPQGRRPLLPPALRLPLVDLRPGGVLVQGLQRR
eukprot:EG_transcript_35495